MGLQEKKDPVMRMMWIKNLMKPKPFPLKIETDMLKKMRKPWLDRKN